MLQTAVVGMIMILLLFGGCNGDDPTEPEVEPGNEPELVIIPGGVFDMGCCYGWAKPSEFPMHQVTVDTFSISRYEITNAQYALYDSVQHGGDVHDNHPVVYVSWCDAAGYCNWLSLRHGLEPFYDDSTLSNPDTSYIGMNWESNGYRLPTEAEWEYACRGNTTMDTYEGFVHEPGCEPLDEALNRIGWYCGNSDSTVHTVGGKKANIFGLHDTIGNVWEWCNDWFGDYHDRNQSNPRGPDVGSSRIRRGGSWRASARQCRSSSRNQYNPWLNNDDIGFRIVQPH